MGSPGLRSGSLVIERNVYYTSVRKWFFRGGHVFVQCISHATQIHLWGTGGEFRKRVMKFIFVELCKRNSPYLC